MVARAIYHSKIPIISAVGHETDYTIADFVADLRAPTPSAAAELVIRDKREIKNALHYLEGRLENETFQILEGYRTHLSHLIKIFKVPRKRIEEYFLRTDDLFNRLRLLCSWTLERRGEAYAHLSESLHLRNPMQKVRNLRLLISEVKRRMGQHIKYSITIRRQNVAGVIGKLDSLSPLSILQRGYSITRKLPSLQILRDIAYVKEGDKVEVKLSRGTLLCGVEKTEKS
jgi:exodeoxyribonuclease VII large subunit